MTEDKKLIQAINETISWLNAHEPSCFPCDQCPYGYRKTFETEQGCQKRRKEFSILHKKWEERINYWIRRMEECPVS